MLEALIWKAACTRRVRADGMVGWGMDDGALVSFP